MQRDDTDFSDFETSQIDDTYDEPRAHNGLYTNDHSYIHTSHT